MPYIRITEIFNNNGSVADAVKAGYSRAYASRIFSGLNRGLSVSQSRGKPRLGEFSPKALKQISSSKAHKLTLDKINSIKDPRIKQMARSDFNKALNMSKSNINRSRVYAKLQTIFSGREIEFDLDDDFGDYGGTNSDE